MWPRWCTFLGSYLPKRIIWWVLAIKEITFVLIDKSDFFAYLGKSGTGYGFTRRSELHLPALRDAKFFGRTQFAPTGNKRTMYEKPSSFRGNEGNGLPRFARNDGGKRTQICKNLRHSETSPQTGRGNPSRRGDLAPLCKGRRGRGGIMETGNADCRVAALLAMTAQFAPTRDSPLIMRFFLQNFPLCGIV